jgi:hypothetical protein
VEEVAPEQCASCLLHTCGERASSFPLELTLATGLCQVNSLKLPRSVQTLGKAMETGRVSLEKN